MTNSALVRGEVKVRRRHFLDRFFKFVSLGVNLYITCVIYRRASHAGPSAPLCFARIMGVCNCSMFCCTLLYVHSSIAIILMGKRELVALLNLSSWCLVMVERLFLAVPRGCLRFVIVVFPDHTHYFFYKIVCSHS